MVFTSDTFFDWIFGIIKGVNILEAGTNYLVALGIVFVTAILISPRKMSNIKVLALPLMIGYSLIGLEIPLMFMVVGGIVFTMDILSTKGIGDMIEGMRQKVSEVRAIPEMRRERRTASVEKRVNMAGIVTGKQFPQLP